MTISSRKLIEFIVGEVAKAVEITSRYPKVHGAPVHIGSPVSQNSGSAVACCLYKL